MHNKDVSQDSLSAMVFKLVQCQLRPPSTNDTKLIAQHEQYQLKVFRYLLRILGSRISPTNALLSDELAISDHIKKKLMKENRVEDALKFSELYRRLMGQKKFSNKWGILYLLNSLCSENDEKDRSVNLSFLEKYTTKSTIFDDSKKEDKHKMETEPSDTSSVILPTKQSKKLETSAWQVSEEVLLREIIYAFQGIEGTYVRFDPFLDGFAVDSKIEIPRSTRDLVRKLCELGWLYKHVKSFIDLSLQQTNQGLVLQSFVAAVNKELNAYYHLLSELQTQVHESASKSSYQQLSLRRLAVWTVEPLERLKILAILVDACKGKRGGALASVVHAYVNHGDPFIRSLVERIITQVSNPILEMTRKWVLEGELEDPYQEFFISSDPNVPIAKLWYDKYSLRTEMLPTFITQELAKKILIIGKSINFIRKCCKDAEWVMDSNTIAIAKDGLSNVSSIENIVDRAAKVTNKRVMDLIFDTFKFSKHCTAIKKYLLLGQGDFIQYLLDLLKSDLNKPPNTIYRHNLLGLLETAIRSSNLHTDDPEILERLDVRILPEKTGSLGWDVFTLDYNISTPLDTIFTKEVMNKYIKIFKWLWRIKRVETLLNGCWKKHMTTAHLLQKVDKTSDLNGIHRLLHASNVIRHEMLHFMNNLQYFLMFEVSEKSWEEFVKETRQLYKDGDLDGLIKSHNKYLETIEKEALVGPTSEDQELKDHIDKMLSLIMQFISIQSIIYTSAMSQITTQQRKQEEEWEKMELSKLENKSEEETKKKPERKMLEFKQDMEQIKKSFVKLVEIRKLYSSYFNKLLNMLTQRKNNENLQYLRFRLDFSLELEISSM